MTNTQKVYPADQKTVIAKRTINLGKVDGYHSGRKTCPLTVEVEITEVTTAYDKWTTDLQPTRKYHTVSFSGNVWNHINTDTITSGQMQDSLLGYLDTPQTRKIVDFWNRFHNSDLNAGTTRQDQVIALLPDLTTMENRLAVAGQLITINLASDGMTQGAPALIGYNGQRKNDEGLAQWIARRNKEIYAKLDNWDDKRDAVVSKLIDPKQKVDRHDFDLRCLWLMAHNAYAQPYPATNKYDTNQHKWVAVETRYYTYGSQWLVNALTTEDHDLLVSFVRDEESQPAPTSWLDAVTVSKVTGGGYDKATKRYDWKVTLAYQGRQSTFPFFNGSGKMPERDDLLHCLYTDLSGPQSTDDLASEYGYTPSEASKIARLLEENNERLAHLFGEDFDRFYSDANYPDLAEGEE